MHKVPLSVVVVSCYRCLETCRNKEMICDVCLEENEQSIDFISDEGIHLNVAEIVYRHLSFCFEVNAENTASKSTGGKMTSYKCASIS